MIRLFEQDIKTVDRQSSKGNQLKWMKDDEWYKADYTGYEGLSEYVVSQLLKRSSLESGEYVIYETTEIAYGSNIFSGCKSENFLRNGWQLITLERLFSDFYGESLYKSVYKIQDYESRLRFLVEQTERITGLKEFGKYMCKLLTIDALFLNEDRHTHNIAVLVNEAKNYRYCPIFDNGATLLSDTTMDYPMNGNVLELMEKVRAKTFCSSLDEQLDVAEKLYGDTVRFDFARSDVIRILENEPFYKEEQKERILEILTQQIRKYQYLFKR